MKNHFSENLRYLRRHLKLSQSALAEKLGYSRSNIASYEFGGSEPNIIRLREIANFFKVELDALLGYSIEKSMYDNRLKEKPISNNSEIPDKLKSALMDLKSDCAEIASIQAGLKQFLNFKKKQLKTPDLEMKSIIQEYEKLLDLMDYLLEKNNALIALERKGK